MALSIAFPSVQVNSNNILPTNQYYSDGVNYYRYKIFSGDEIRENPDLLNAIMYDEVIFTESFLREFGNDVHWCALCDEQEIDSDFVREQKDNLDFWDWISENVDLPLKFIEEFADYLNWREISKRQNLTEEFIRKHIDKVVFYEIYKNPNLSEQFWRDYKNRIIWSHAIIARNFSEEFLLEFKKEIEKEGIWDSLSLYQNLSDEFMKKYHINPSLTNFFKTSNIIQSCEITYGRNKRTLIK